MHKIVTDKPGHRDIAHRQAKLAEAERKFQEREAQQRKEYEAALTKHQRETQRALEEGALLPGDVPRPPQSIGDGSVFLTRRLQLREEHRQWLRTEADRLGRELEGREAKLLREAAEQVRVLRQLAAELDELRATAREVRVAAEDGTPVYEGAVSVGQVVRAVEEGWTFQRPPLQTQNRVTYLGGMQ